uniref:mRNA-capping enzyme n=1 Tax=Strongyloides papillosus TaxID=174720 RepID=A0A0N5BNW6_STREA
MKRRHESPIDVENGLSMYKKSAGPNESSVNLGIPDRWLYCPKIGKVISEMFVPFKTPLSSLYDSQIPDSSLYFHPQDVFDAKLEGAPIGSRIKLWIDLTKTSRYYSEDEVRKNDCTYVKIALAGHGKSPTEDETDLFVKTCSDFIEKNPKTLIGVHCTHGFNRTGFLIAAYLASKEYWNVCTAVEVFSKARPFGIYKQDYLDDLYERYNDDEEVPPLVSPGRPAWENGPEEKNTSNSHGSNADSKGGNGSENNGIPQFMSGLVKCAEFVENTFLCNQLRSIIKGYCRYEKNDFPGSQPVSLERSPNLDNFEFLFNEDYMVSWKADGVRYLVLIKDEDEIYAFDRNNNVFKINNLYFPHRKELRHIRDTLVDTEIIMEKTPISEDEFRTIPRMLIYDVVHYEDTQVVDCDYRKRIMCIQREIIEPRKKAMFEGKIVRENEEISVRWKQFYELAAVPKLFEPKFYSTLGHDIDGLIFQPVKDPYVGGRFDKILKWKPPEQSSIDFKLHIKKVEKKGDIPKFVGFLYVLGQQKPFAQMKATKSLQKYDGKIIECNFVNNQWTFMRERTDKSHPNALKTALSVLNTIRYPITRELLIRSINTRIHRTH